jgi:integrase
MNRPSQPRRHDEAVRITSLGKVAPTAWRSAGTQTDRPDFQTRPGRRQAGQTFGRSGGKDRQQHRREATVRVDVKKTASAHDLRRAYGERWASRLMPAQLMELMRHESIETTLNFYVGRNAERTAAILWDHMPRATNEKLEGGQRSVASGSAAPHQHRDR